MRIKEFKIKNQHKNFENLEIDISKCDGVAAFIGDNASGKSNLLEALSALFKNIYLDEKDEFEYYLEYVTFSENVIKIVSDKNKRVYAVDGNPVHDIKKYLPKRVVAVYSGEENRLWKKNYEPIYLNYIHEIINDSNLDYPRMLFLNKSYWHIILLCLIISEADDVKKFVKEKLGIFKINEIKFHFLKANYNKYKNNPALNLIRKLDSKNTYTIDEFKKTISDNDSIDYNITDIFQALYVAYTPEYTKIIKDIEITFNDDLNLSLLSEGQKKLLLIKATLEFASSEDTLVLLDEPDAHIHIGNKQEIVKVFEPYKDTRQIILTTHSPTLTQSLKDKNVFMLSNGEIINHDRQNIINELTNEFWSKQRQNLFLASNKDIILLVEGKHDKKHITNAFNKLKEDFPDLDFDIFSLKGEKNIVPMLRGLRDANLNDNKVYIGIYDNDHDGQNSLNNKSFKKVDNRYYKKLLENCSNHNNYFAFALPKPSGFKADCTIENMYDKNKFKEAFLEAVKKAQSNSKDKSVKGMAEDIKDNAKKLLAEESNNFTKNEFNYFIPLFNIIDQIKKDSLDNIYKNNQSDESEKKSLDLLSLMPQKPKNTEEQHFENRNDVIVNLYKNYRDTILEMDNDLDIIPNKYYIAFKKRSNVCDIAIQKKQLKIWLNLKKGKLNDENRLTKDVSSIGHPGNGDYEIVVNENTNKDDVIELIGLAIAYNTAPIKIKI